MARHGRGGEVRRDRSMGKQKFEWVKWIPICIVAVVLMVIYKVVDNITNITKAIEGFLIIISPLLYGVLFSYFFYVPHLKIEKLFLKSKRKFITKRARGLSTIVVFLLLIMIVALIVIFVAPIVIRSAIDLASSVPTYINRILSFIDNIPEDSVWSSLDIAGLLRESSSGIVNEYLNAGRIEQVARGIISLAGEISSVLLGLIMSLYLLWEREKIGAFFTRLSNVVFKNDKVRNGVTKYLSQINRVLFTFIASKGLDSLINIVVVTSILLIFNVPYAFLLGLIFALLNFIPYLGSLIAVVLTVLITLITGGLSAAIKVLIPLLVFQQIDGNYIEPRIMKSSLKISPILVIVAVVAGGAYFGMLGMFLAVPIVVIVKQVLIEYMQSSEDTAIKESADDAEGA